MARKTRRNKRNGGGNNNPTNVNNSKNDPTNENNSKNDPNNQSGGKRRGKKTRRASKGASDWNKKVMMIYHELKRKNPLTKLGAAMKEASRRKKQGKL